MPGIRASSSLVFDVASLNLSKTKLGIGIDIEHDWFTPGEEGGKKERKKDRKKEKINEVLNRRKKERCVERKKNRR